MSTQTNQFQSLEELIRLLKEWDDIASKSSSYSSSPYSSSSHTSSSHYSYYYSSYSCYSYSDYSSYMAGKHFAAREQLYDLSYPVYMAYKSKSL